MKRIYYSLLIFLFGINLSFSQLQTAKWYFGANAGLDFMTGPGILTNGMMNPWEGCASISDASGNLLFYTDGLSVWNKTHAVMANGTGLFGNSSSTQAGVIVQKPGSANIYYVFTEDAQAGVNGLCYSTVDMNLAAGNGSVTVKNTPLFTPSDEKITAVRHCNGIDVWVVTHDWNTNNFRCYLVTAAGVGAAVNSAVGTVHNGSNANTIGQMKASPNGRKLGLAIHDTPFNAFELYDFNNATGVVSNMLSLGTNFPWAYGCEFSPDGTKFYGGHYGGGAYEIFQWNICAGSSAGILASKYLVFTMPAMPMAIQAASNGKLYVCRYATNACGVINSPNSLGAACSYVDLGQSVSPKMNNLGLPNFITSFLKTPPPPFTYTVNSAVSCLTASFSPPSISTVAASCSSAGYSVTGMTWNFGDPGSGPLNTSTVTNPGHLYPGPGTYTTTLIINYACSADTIKLPVNLVSPTISINTTSATCSTPGSATVTVGAGMGPYSYTWSPSAQTTSVATNLSPGVYTVTVKDNGGGCVVTGTANLGSQSVMTGTVTSSSVTCNGASTGSASLSITGTGPFTYTWTPSAQTTSVASGLAAGVYTVIGKDNSSGCTVTQTVNITQPTALTLNIASSSPSACVGSNITLTATAAGGTSSYNYLWTSGPATSVYTVAQPVGGNYVYTATATDANSCQRTGTFGLTFVNNPTLTATSSTVCIGTTATLTANGASTYTWNPGNVVSNVYTAAPALTTTMTVVGAIGACTATTTAVITVNALPTPTATNTGPYCPGNTIQLNVGAFSTYTWSGPGPYSSNIQNATQANAQTTNGGNYTVAVTDANGCTNTAVTNVVVNPTPVVVIGSNSPVCLNNAINLTSNGGTGYAWSGPNSFSSALQNPTIPSATIADAGVYTVTVTSLGCTNTGTVNVTVTTPTTSASNTGPYCAGATITFSAPAATSYSWSGPGGYTSNVQNATRPGSTPAMSGTYSLIVSIGTCTANATTNVIVNALPTPTAGSNSPVCVGQAINLTGSSAVTYTWAGPSGFTSNVQNPVIPMCGLPNGGTNTLTVTDANGCTNFVTVNVVVNPLPNIVVNNPTVCVNQAINLTSNGGTTYSWSGPNSFSSNLQNPTVPSATLNMAGQYTVLVTSAAGCTNTGVSNVTVYPLPNPNIAGNSPVCVGGTLNLQGGGGASYVWNGPGYSGPNQNPTINNVTASAAGVYTLLVSSGSCTASTTYTVVINPLPVFNFSGSNVTCNGLSNGTSTVNVSVGTGPYNYNWSTIPVQTAQNASGLVAGTYSCLVTDANNCSSIASTQITQPTAFSVSINSMTFSACANSPINVTAIGAGGTGPYNYNWVSGPSSSLYSVNEAVSGNYNYVVNATDAFNCPAAANINLTFFPQPTVTATSATVCAGQTTVLTASGANTYVWQPGNITGPTYPFSGNTSVNVSVVGTANGCSNSVNTNVMVNPNPNSSISVGNAKGCVPSCVTFSAGASANIASYNWILNGAGITGSVNGAYCFDEAASYTLGLTVMDAFGCTSTVVPVTIDIYAQPVADFNHAPLKPIVNQDPFVTFTDASWGAPIVSWNWYFMNTAQYTSTEQNPTFSYTEPGTYPVVLVVKSDKGCTDTLIRPLVVGEDFGIYVPNAFTPNGDGVNDIFQPKGFGVVKYELNIFDRWGEKVFSTKDFEKGWDGTMQSKNDVKYGIIEEGTYTWLINCTSVFGKSHELKGHVVLMK
jgi:gliding motility-associated-like protein